MLQFVNVRLNSEETLQFQIGIGVGDKSFDKGLMVFERILVQLPYRMALLCEDTIFFISYVFFSSRQRTIEH